MLDDVEQQKSKVWISRKKSSWPHLGPPGPIFCMGGKNRFFFFAYAFYFIALGPLLLSTRGGQSKHETVKRALQN